MTRERIRPRPSAGTLSAQVLALACRDKDADQRMLGATSNDELEAWCKDLADKLSTYGDLEAAHARIAELELAIAAVTNDHTTVPGSAVDAAKARLAELERPVDDQELATFPPAITRVIRMLEVRAAEREAQLVDLLALELEFVRMLRAGGVLPADDPPPSTTDLLALVRSMRS